MIAHRLGIDRIELRRRNLIASNDMPYSRPLAINGHPILLDSAIMPDCSVLRWMHSDGTPLRHGFKSGGLPANWWG